MADKKYLIIKEKNDSAITYFEYDKIQGYDLAPKQNVKIKDAINVSKVVVINPSLMHKVAKRKVDLKFKKLLQYVTTIFENGTNETDDETGSVYREGLNEIEKFRQEARNRYFQYMKDEEIHMTEKKLEILEQELKMRLFYLQQIYQYNYQEEYTKEGKSR
ncbi:MAG: hypothetical protein PUB18_06420 [bacterium]|nr:hypothetical protein [bacterium]